MPKVSVLIPVYNLEAYINETLDSVFAQDLQDFEIVLVDDASTDGTLAKIREYTDPRLRVIALPENGGTANARNLVMQHAQGEYLAFLDGDDVALPHRLSRQTAFLDAHPDIDALGSYYRTFGKPKVWKFPLNHGAMHGEALFRLPLRTSALMFRKSARDKANVRLNPKYRVSQDWDLTHQLLAAGCRFATLPEVLVKYRLHAGQTSQQYAARNISYAQNVLHDTVRRWIPDCTEADLALHSAISRRKPDPLLDDADRVAAWLNRFYTIALERRIPDPDSFFRALASQWEHVSALYATQGLGVALKRYFSQARFCRALGLSGHAAFVARCFKVRRKAAKTNAE